MVSNSFAISDFVALHSFFFSSSFFFEEKNYATQLKIERFIERDIVSYGSSLLIFKKRVKEKLRARSIFILYIVRHTRHRPIV